jgi:hypothetical protein
MPQPRHTPAKRTRDNPPSDHRQRHPSAGDIVASPAHYSAGASHDPAQVPDLAVGESAAWAFGDEYGGAGEVVEAECFEKGWEEGGHGWLWFEFDRLIAG